MRKFFEGHSRSGVVLILFSFLAALFLRFYHIGLQSPWSDELASWWYSRHLGEVWAFESHSPLYYALLKIFTFEGDITSLRVFSATLSVIHLIEFFFLGQIVFDKKKFLLFWILVCLNPVDIVYARMARHYSWLLEGVLVFYLLLRAKAPTWLLSFTAAFMGFIHVFAVIPIVFYTWSLKQRFRIIGPACLIFIYYSLRLILLGSDVVKENVSWITLGPVTFWSSVVTMFMGESYPRFEFFPVNPVFSALVLLSTFGLIAYKKKQSGVRFYILFAVSLLIIELLQFWLNLRSNRYLIYLVGLWIVAIVDSPDETKERWAWVTAGALTIYLIIMRPLAVYSWDSEKVAEWNKFQVSHPVSQRLVCANRYQSAYYQLKASDCENMVVNEKEPLLVFDLNTHYPSLMVKLSKSMVTEENEGYLAKFVPRNENEK